MDIVEVVQALEPSAFFKSETAHSPPNSQVWHDTYNLPWDDRWQYLKFVGETVDRRHAHVVQRDRR